MRAAFAVLILLAAVAPAAAQQPAPPRMLVPPDVRPGEVAPDPGIRVPEHVVPAPQGSGADLRIPPAASDPMAVRPDTAVVPHGGGDPGILAPAPSVKRPD